VLTDLFPFRACINLDRRPERWRRMQRRFARHGLAPVERFPAVDGADLAPPAGWTDPPGAYGCLLSHLAVVREARRRGAPQVLIFEDDAVFHSELQERFAACAAEIPTDWDMLFLGGLHEFEPLPVSPHVVRLTSTYSTYAYALRHTVYDAFLELNGRAAAPVDNNNRILQRRFACYCLMPHLAWVEDGYSDAQGTAVNHWYLRGSLILKGAEMERALQRTAVILHGADRRLLRFAAERYLGCLPGVLVVAAPEESRGAAGRTGRSLAACGNLAAFAGAAPGAERDLFFVASSAVCLEPPSLRASLLMGLRHDFVSPFRQLADLDAEATRAVLAGRGVDTSRHPLRRRGGLCGTGTWLLSRGGLAALGALDEVRSERALARRVRQRLSVFAAPGTALRLRAGEG
jgi:glycosyl transferase family 25